jgi:hypothetical protein
VLAESGLQLRKRGFVVVSFRAGDLRAQIAYAVVDATGWHTIECYRVLVGYHTFFCVELLTVVLGRVGVTYARAEEERRASTTKGTKVHEGQVTSFQAYIIRGKNLKDVLRFPDPCSS